MSHSYNVTPYYKAVIYFLWSLKVLEFEHEKAPFHMIEYGACCGIPSWTANEPHTKIAK